MYTLLLVVQQEEPAFVLAVRTARSRRSHSAHCRVRCASAHPRAQQRWRSVRCLPEPGGPAQLLVGTVATGETAAPALHYIAATPATWADCAGRTASARIDTASLLDAAARTRLGYGEDPIAVCTAAQASELIAQLQAALPGAGEGCMARAAVWAAFLPAGPGAAGRSADGLRSRSARLLTDLLAADLNALGETLAYLSARTALTIDYTTAAVAAARGGVQLTEEGMAAVCALLL